MKRRIAYAFFVALFGAFFANIFNVHVKVPCPKITPVNISNLKRIEKEIFPHQQLKLGKNKNFNYLKPLIDEYDQTNNKKRIGEIEEEILNEYFKVSNQELYNHLDKIEEKLRSNKKDRYITYIHGPAGIGKSFVMKKYKEKYGDDVVCVNLHKLFKAGAKVGGVNIIEYKQLYDGDYVLGSMPTLESENIGQFDFEIFLKENGCYRNNNDIYPIIILDDLDEIHPKSSEALLEKIDDFIQNKEKSDVSLNFIIFGRTESFSWFSSPHCTRKNLFEFRIHGLDYSYEQDMKIMAMTYLVYYKKEKETDQVVKKTIDIINKYPFLIYTIKNLDNSLFLMKRILENAKKTELKLKEELLDEIIGRNSSTHKRPPTGTSKGLEYIRLLENIAGEYFNKIDKEGYFEVSIQDQIKLIKKEEEQKCDELKDLSDCNIDTYNFDVQSVLNFSGLVEVKPINHIVKKYRFEPFWIHELLISKRQKRINIP